MITTYGIRHRDKFVYIGQTKAANLQTYLRWKIRHVPWCTNSKFDKAIRSFRSPEEAEKQLDILPLTKDETIDYESLFVKLYGTFKNGWNATQDGKGGLRVGGSRRDGCRVKYKHPIEDVCRWYYIDRVESIEIARRLGWSTTKNLSNLLKSPRAQAWKEIHNYKPRTRYTRIL